MADVPPYQPDESTFRALIEHAEDILLLADREARILYASPSVERLFGFTPEEMVGQLGFAFTDPAMVEAQQALLSELVATSGHRITIQHRTRHRDGHYIDLSLTIQNRLDDPDIRALVVNARDRTEHNRLAALEEQLRHLAENTRDIVAVYQVEPEHKLSFISPSVEHILGYPPEEFYADPAIHLRLIHPDDLAQQEALVRASAEVRAKPWTFRWRHADGRTIWIEQRVVPTHDANGRLVSVQSISRDVTEKVLLEEELRRANKLQAIGRLAGGIAHDFNNLMAVVRLSSGALARSRAGDASLLRELAQIDAAIDRGVGLVRQLLAFSRQEEGGDGDEVIDLARTVGDLEAILRRLLPESIDIAVNLSADRPWVGISAARLEQVVINLAANARDAMPDGGQLHIAVTGRADRVSLSVRDNGVGMDAEQRARIFDPFYSTKEPGRGTGLGLAVVYGVVEQTGGRIDTDSTPGVGTEIRVSWPRAARPPSGADAPEPAPGRGQLETVLLVEDEEALRALIADLLESAGFRVVAATDSNHALELGNDANQRIDLLLSDVVMPGMGGRRLAEKLREQRAKLPVLFISGYPGDPAARDSATQMLAKPFTAKELTGAVRRCLDHAPCPCGSGQPRLRCCGA